ncbi:MAG: phage minor capsid protein [Candidatus Coproplasma sp.]
MKNNKDEKGLVELIQSFKDEEHKVLYALTHSRLSISEYKKHVKQTISKTVSVLCEKAREYSKRELPSAFKEGQDKTDSAKVEHLSGSSTPPRASAKLANEVLNRFGFKYSGRSLSYDTYIEIQHATEAAGNGLIERVNGIIDRLGKSGEDTIYNVTRAISDDIKKSGLLNVEYSNGRRVPIDHYAATAARSARIESANIGAFGRAIQNGTDYVKCTEIYPTCEVCARYQGKIYCISGNDSRFPSLFDTALRKGYALIHPNCRHEFIPVWLELLDDNELKKELDSAKISGKDSRSINERNAYAQWQESNRAYNAEKLYYERSKRLLGKDFPYSDIGSFRRSYRAKTGTNAHTKSHNLIKDYQQYEQQLKVLGDGGVKSFAKYRELKYNEDRQEYDNLKLQVADEKVRRRLGSDELPLKIQADKQGKHIRGHKNFTDNKSYLAVETVEEGLALSQEIVGKYHGTGEIRRTRSGEWKHTERVLTDRVIGFAYKYDGTLVETKVATIHYSKNGTHIVPTIWEG